jgi:hypothetical protein
MPSRHAMRSPKHILCGHVNIDGHHTTPLCLEPSAGVRRAPQADIKLLKACFPRFTPDDLRDLQLLFHQQTLARGTVRSSVHVHRLSCDLDCIRGALIAADARSD